MNKTSKIFFCGIFSLTAMATNAQDKKEKKAQKEISDYAFVDAIDTYKGLVDKGYGNQEIYSNLGDANYRNARYAEASSWYGKLFTLEGADIDPDYMYRYAQSLKSTGKYKDSDSWMDKYKAAKGSDVRSQRFDSNRDYLGEIEKASGRYDIKNLGINSTESDFAPSFYMDELVFSTARDSGVVSKKINNWNQKAFLNLYKAVPSENGDFTTSDKLSKIVNKKTHESSTAFTKDGNTVYFTRNNSANGKFARDTEGVSRLKIYRAKLKDGDWTEITELPFNGADFSTAHPTLSPDESMLYFASDREGSLGQSDIFVVEINSDGTFGAPRNLGNKINTESRETFPFVTSENTLYFASDGHPGLGGLDVFATNLSDLDNSLLVNVGKPVNGEQDDFSFIIDSGTGKGYFASNREGGLGGDDIYGFTENEKLDLSCTTVIQGMVKDAETGAPLTDAKVIILNRSNQLVAETVSDSDGSFALEGDCKDGDYKLVASKEDYNGGEQLFAVVGANDMTDVEIALEKTVTVAKTGTNIIQHLGLKPIYFDLDKAVIRPDALNTMERVIAYMKEYPALKVEVRSYTDVKNTKAYNMALSERRAVNTVAYLTANGIDASRISGKGFGETQLTNDCISRESCSDDRHEENRRSEVIVVD